MGNHNNTGLQVTKVFFTLLSIAFFSYLIIAADYFKVDMPRFNNNLARMTQLAADHAGIDLGQVVVSVEQPGVITYVVRQGDNISTIAQKFGTTVSTIKQVNSLSSDFLRAGQTLIVSDITGILYTMKEKTNVIVFANKYDLDLEEMKALNSFQYDNHILYEGDEVFLPLTTAEGIEKGLLPKPKPKPVPKPVVAAPTTTVATTAAPVSTAASTAAQPVQITTVSAPAAPTRKSSVVASWNYNNQVYNGFARGHCTWYAAQKRPDIFPFESETKQNRPFGGNANQWLRNAQAKGLATGDIPRPGSVVVYSVTAGQYAAYGHVAIVLSVDWNDRTMLIEEMNFRKTFVVTQRVVTMDDKRIGGYIY